jgi:hypothetical protein
LTSELGLANIPVDLRRFNRISPHTPDPRLILEATTPVDRRALFMAIKQSQSHLRAHLHLTPQGKANKSLLYFISSKYPVSVQDRGDIVCISWRSNPAICGRIEIGKTAGEVELALNIFLEARPHDTHPKKVHT